MIYIYELSIIPMRKTLFPVLAMILAMIVTNGMTAQTLPIPKLSIIADSNCIKVNGECVYDTRSAMMQRTTNYNPSIRMDDTLLSIAQDSLQSDRKATIVTVYETDDEEKVGLWEITDAGSAKLWLNSQYASYEDFHIRYRKDNERGVIVHTMTYTYPDLDSLYTGHDTLTIGKCDTIVGHKNFCAFVYYDQELTFHQRRKQESALAIRYGAWLHGPYVNSANETVWDPAGKDSAYSHGICGIGRDDSISLHQERSIIRNDMLSVSAAEPMQDRVHVMMGHDGKETTFNSMQAGEEEDLFCELDRHWKIRMHGADSQRVTFQMDSAYRSSGNRLKIESDQDTRTVSESDTLTLAADRDYLVSVLVSGSVDGQDTKQGARNHEDEDVVSDDYCNVAVSPNPTTGNYAVEVIQSEEDYIGIQVTDVNGRTVEEFQTQDQVDRYRHVSSLSVSGVYYVTVRSNGKQKTVKMIVVR